MLCDVNLLLLPVGHVFKYILLCDQSYLLSSRIYNYVPLAHYCYHYVYVHIFKHKCCFGKVLGACFDRMDRCYRNQHHHYYDFQTFSGLLLRT